MKTRHTAITLPLASAIAAAALILTGCSSPGGDEGTGSGDGVPYGASKEDYIAAFEDIDPISIRIQSEGTEGTNGSIGRDEYGQALEEWSGGKISIEFGYANAFCPNALEWNDCLADGRVDIALVLPSYEPDIFPLNSQLATAGVIDKFTSTGPLISSAWVSEVGWEDKYVEELQDNGIQPLLPFNNTYSYTTLFCANPLTTLDDYAGLQISASGTLKAAEVSSLGAVPVAMPFTDQYEGLQRGVIACALTSTGAVDASGLAPLTPWGIFDPRTAWESPLPSFAAGKDFWDGLPLVAQQLIFDRLDVLIKSESLHQGERNALLLEDLKANGGGTVELDSDARDAVNAVNEDALDALDDADAYREASEKWTDIIVDELGYGDEPFAEWLESGGWETRDYDPLVERLFDEFLLSHRPS